MAELHEIRNRLKGKVLDAKLALWRKVARAYVELSIFEARWFLRRNGPITVLVDNSVLGHGVTHETRWIDTGTAMWGDTIPINTGYSARVPVHAPNAPAQTYAEVRYIVGIAELAKRGLIKLATSAELQAEALRQPLGRFRGYGSFDLNVFDGLEIGSVDGYQFDPVEVRERQQSRLRASSDEPFITLCRLLPEKSNLDAWHIHTAHKHNLYCFLALDFPLSKNMAQAQRRKEFPQLDTKVMLPSELAAAIRLRPIETFAISYQDSSWAVRHDLNSPEGRRVAPRRRKNRSSGESSMPDDDEPSPINRLPHVAEMMGARISYGGDAVGLQYRDDSGEIHQLDMSLGDALYLLSVLKGMQLTLDIPFPDDPRDPDAKAIKPSERTSA